MQRRKTVKPHDAPKTARRGSSLVAGKQKQIAQLARERDEALQRLAAASEVLQIISRSPGELEPVFRAMLANAVQICGADFGMLFRFEDAAWRAGAMFGVPLAFAEFWQRGPQSPGPRTALGRVAETKQMVHIADVTAEPAYVEGEAIFVAAVNLGGFRTILSVPVLNGNELVGAIAIYRTEVNPFADKQVELVTNFASQAVIAIENTRLLNQLRQRTDDLSEALEQQTATSEVLQVISSSAGELQPIFQTMLSSATRICDATFGDLYLRDADGFRMVSTHNSPPAFAAARTPDRLLRPPSDAPLGLVSRTLQVAHVHDIRTIRSYITGDSFVTAGVELAGYRTILAVPMLKDNKLVGAITICRLEVRPFTEKQIELLTNFAAQAVIAIENTRLLNELRRIVAAADRHCRGAQGHQPLDVRSADSARYADRIGRASVRGRHGGDQRATTARVIAT